MVVPIAESISYTGQKRMGVKGIDACIAPIVKALNDAGIETVNSCCGHGESDGSIVLADGRELVVKGIAEPDERESNARVKGFRFWMNQGGKKERNQMHYKNGREAKNGDKVVLIPEYGPPVAGILYDATPGNDYCNGRIAVTTQNDPCPNLKEVLHFDDIARAAAQLGPQNGSEPSATSEGEASVEPNQ